MISALRFIDLRESQQAHALALAALSLIAHPGISNAGNVAGTAAAQTERASSAFSPPDIVSGPDFRILMKMMRTNIVNCGFPRTAVVHWHVRPDGLIDRFVLYKPSSHACFDEIVTLNAAAVVQAGLHITPGKRDGVAEAAWVPMSVAARD